MRFLKFSIKSMIFLFVAFVICLIGIYTYAYLSPKLDLKTSGSLYIYDNDENLIYQGSSSNEWANIEDISPNLINAVIAIEDKNFYNHNGFDYLIRPSYDNLGIINGNLIYLVAKDKTDNYIIDSTGKKISEVIPGTIKSANSDYIVSLNSNKYDLYAYDKSKLLER